MTDEREANPNSRLWREMQEPHEDIAAADAAYKAFYEGLGELRKQHRMADVLCVVRLRVVDPDDAENDREALLSCIYGDSLREESLAAYAFGEATSRRQQMISDLATGKNIKRAPKAKP